MNAEVAWKQGMSFVGSTHSGFSLPMGVGDEERQERDFLPMELLLIGIAGCTAMDVISIMTKKKQKVHSFKVKIHGDRSQEHPKIFTRIGVEYIFSGTNLDPTAAQRSVELSVTKYCPALAMLRKEVEIQTRITIHQEQ